MTKPDYTPPKNCWGGGGGGGAVRGRAERGPARRASARARLRSRQLLPSPRGEGLGGSHRRRAALRPAERGECLHFGFLVSCKCMSTRRRGAVGPCWATGRDGLDTEHSACTLPIFQFRCRFYHLKIANHSSEC